MRFAKVVGGVLIDVDIGLPGSARRLSDNVWVSPPNGLINGTVVEQESCGYFIITEVAKPVDQAGKVWVEGYSLTAGRPTQTWTLRNFTPGETTEATRNTNLTDVATKARNAIAVNDNFLAIASPTNAQNAAQIKILTRECTGIIRALGQSINEMRDLLDSTSGT